MEELFLDNKSFEYINQGHENTIVLLNGLFADYQSWNGCLEEVKAHFNILRFNFFGQGVQSIEQLDLVDLNAHCHQLAYLLDELQIESAYLLGISHGARVGLKFACEYPNRVKGLIAANSYLNPDKCLERKLDSWKEANRLGGGLLRFDVATPWIWGKTTINNQYELLDFYRSKANGIDPKLADRLISQAMKSYIFTLKQICSEIVIVSSDEDILTPRNYQYEIGGKLKNVRHELVKGGHASLLEYPETIFQILKPWIHSSSLEFNDVV